MRVMELLSSYVKLRQTHNQHKNGDYQSQQHQGVRHTSTNTGTTICFGQFFLICPPLILNCVVTFILTCKPFNISRLQMLEYSNKVHHIMTKSWLLLHHLHCDRHNANNSVLSYLLPCKVFI